MTWFQGEATDYIDLADQLVQLATSRSVASAVISVAGSGYSVGDILTLTAGTFTHAAQFEVTSVGGSGEVTGVRVYSGGAYTVDPGGASATTVVPSGGSGCTITLTNADTGWTSRRNIYQRGATEVILGSGGTGYTVDDILTVQGGTPVTATTIRVTQESSGVITGMAIEDPGEYLEGDEPTSPVSVVGGSGGDDATFTLVYHGTDDRKQVILEGEGSGTDEIFVGLNSYFNSGTSARNWELAGMTGYDESLAWEGQPGKSPGEFADQGTFDGGAYMLLNNTTTPFWCSITPRRIIMIAKVGSAYSTMHLGLLNAFSTTVEYPYPMFICGQTNDHLLAFNSSPLWHSSIADPISDTQASNFVGPGLLRLSSGSWIPVANSNFESNTKDELHSCVIYPSGQPVNTDPASSPVSSDDRIVTNGAVYWTRIIPVIGNPGTQSVRLLPTPNTDGDITIPIPCTVMLSDIILGLGFMGEIDGLFWLSAEQDSTIISEDTVTFGSDRYKIFQSGPRTELWSFFCVRED